MKQTAAVQNKSGFPQLPREESESKCQSIYWNMLCCIEAGAPGKVLIHELAHTSRCDHINDLSNVRNAVENVITTASLESILNFSMDPRDAEKADIVTAHYASWADSEIYKGLNFWNKVYYQTYFRWDKWASGIAIFSGSVGGIFKVYRRLAKKQVTSQVTW